MDLIKWDDEYNTGIGLIDSQHKQLCSIINKLGSAMDDNEEKEVLNNIVDELIDYTIYHFSVEENYFDKFDFEEQDLHRSEHKYFIEYFKGMKKGLNSKTKKKNQSSEELSMDILKYLIEWFISHITGSDREYIELFKKNGII